MRLSTRYMAVLSLIILTGCMKTCNPRPVPLPDAPDPSKIIEPVRKGMGEVSGDLKDSSDRLGEAADAVRSGADGAQAGAEAGDVQKVRQEAQNLRKTADDIDQEAVELEKSKNEVDVLIQQLTQADLQTSDLKKLYEACQGQLQQTNEDYQKQIDGYEDRIAELTSERDEALQKVLLGIIIGSILLVAFSVGSVINGNPKAVMWAATGVVSLVIANTMRTHSKVFATAGGIGLAICTGLIIYQFWRHRKAEQALEETVHSVEAVKQSLGDDKKKEIFGEGALPGTLDNIQSEGTKRLINEKRLRLKPKLEHTIS